jgi:hypothetical protein
MNFQNPKEVIVNHGYVNIKLFHFSHRCHVFGYSKESLSPIFSVFMISMFATCFYDAYFSHMEMNFKNKREFFSLE